VASGTFPSVTVTILYSNTKRLSDKHNLSIDARRVCQALDHLVATMTDNTFHEAEKDTGENFALRWCGLNGVSELGVDLPVARV
jgi:hypothetical protein